MKEGIEGFRKLGEGYFGRIGFALNDTEDADVAV